MQDSRSRERRRKDPRCRHRVALGLALGLAALTSTTASAQTLERIRAAGQINLGHRSDARPFSYWDEAQQPAGYSVELCRKIADAVKAELGLPELRVELATVGNHERFLALKQRRIDVLCGAATVTLSRRRDVSFSVPVFLGGIAALLRADAPAALRATLAGVEPQHRTRESIGAGIDGRRVSVRLGTTAESWVAEQVKAFGTKTEVVAAGLHSEAIAAVSARETDVLFGDRPILLDEAQRSPNAADLVVLDRYFTYEPIALGLERGDEDFRLLVDRTLSALYRSGEVAAIYKRHFGEPGEVALGLFSRAALPE